MGFTLAAAASELCLLPLLRDLLLKVPEVLELGWLPPLPAWREARAGAGRCCPGGRSSTGGSCSWSALSCWCCCRDSFSGEACGLSSLATLRPALAACGACSSASSSANDTMPAIRAEIAPSLEAAGAQPRQITPARHSKLSSFPRWGPGTWWEVGLSSRLRLRDAAPSLAALASAPALRVMRASLSVGLSRSFSADMLSVSSLSSSSSSGC
jgi:hypothetical protein